MYKDRNSLISHIEEPLDERDKIELDLRRYKEFFGTEDFEFGEFYKRLVPPELQTDYWR